MSTDTLGAPTDRRTFLRNAGVAGVGLAGAGSLAALLPAAASANGGLTKSDVKILIAAEIAEALAVTTYTNIINTAPFFSGPGGGRPGLPEGGPPGGDVPLPPRAEPDRQALPLHHLLLPAEDVQRRPDDAERPGHAWRTRSSRPTWSGCATSAPRTCASPRRGSWASRATTAPWPGSSARGSRARTAGRSRRSPASRARPRASTRPTTTATSGRWAGPRSARRSPR